MVYPQAADFFGPESALLIGRNDYDMLSFRK